ncbi:MAG TPA: 4-hydroxybenzoate octaprenyltransferase [Nitrospira sp.]|nr:4-hydroxybenzoate octaprenyltransferase [Nitrospira sp.]
MRDPSSAASDVGSHRGSWPALARLIRLGNQTGTLLLLLPTLWSLVLAEHGVPDVRLLGTFVLGSFLMRSAGVVLNDLADREYDRRVVRTQRRPLATGEATPKQAMTIAAALVGSAALLVLTLNPLTLSLSPIAVCLAALYPFAKRFIHVPQAMLGLAFGWGTIMAWAASRGTVELPAWLLFMATVCWAIGYDTIYALQDADDDRRIGVKSSALFFGDFTWLAVGLSLAGMVLLVGAAGWLSGTGPICYGALSVVGALCVRQVRELRRSVNPLRAFELFHQHVWFGSVILGGLVAGFLW